MKTPKYPKPFCPVCGRLHRPTRVYGVPVVLCPAFPSGAFGLASIGEGQRGEG